MRSIFFSFVLIMVSRILFDVVHLHCSYMQILHQPAMAMVYAMRHCASCALLLPKLILLHSKKQPGHSLILQGTKLSSLQCCPSSQQDATDLWSSPPKTHPHKSHLPPPVSSLPQACVSPLACFTQQHDSQWHCHGYHPSCLHNLDLFCETYFVDRLLEAC